jgi:hypothetical protein
MIYWITASTLLAAITITLIIVCRIGWQEVADAEGWTTQARIGAAVTITAGSLATVSAATTLWSLSQAYLQ